MELSKDLVAASAAPLVLAILAEGESYGYAILKRVADLSGGEMRWTDGMLYPLLHRLERLGSIEARWDDGTAGGRRRKWYRITARGQRELAEHRRQWGVVHRTLEATRDGAEPGARRRPARRPSLRPADGMA